MRKYLLAVLALPLFLLSCSSDDEESEALRYYIKYEAEVTTRDAGAPKFITAAADTGYFRLKEDKSTVLRWERIYGPVDEGFVALLNCNTDEYYPDKSCFGRILVAIEDEPFIVRAEGYGRMVSLKYTVGN